MSEETGANTAETGTEHESNANLPPPTSENGEKGTPAGKTFTQDDVTKMMAKEKSQGRSNALRELGLDPKDTASIDEIKKFLQSKKPEAQVLAEQQIEQQKKIDEANQRAFLAEVKAELMQAGVQTSFLDDAMALLTAKVQAAGESDFPAAIETLKTKYPVWFTNSETKPEGHKGTGSPPKPGSGGSNPKQDDLGKRLAEQAKNSSVTSTYWGSQN